MKSGKRVLQRMFEKCFGVIARSVMKKLEVINLCYIYGLLIRCYLYSEKCLGKMTEPPARNPTQNENVPYERMV